MADGRLDGGAILRQGQVEGRAAAAAATRSGGGFAGGVVVVAELFAAQAWAAASVAIGEDVAALIAFRFVDDWVNDCSHESLPTGVLVVQSFEKKRHESGLLDSSFAFELKKKVRLVAGLRCVLL
ncbi:hypothetical protein RBB77_11935 [Tunturibacter psychrotolerans]|uniref:Uncharacterized protein n=1 Tax=Tunturiibacter psychrotolerans TaxID=3069686 RepID=A0AAU7ZJQ8_9BACT